MSAKLKEQLKTPSKGHLNNLEGTLKKKSLKGEFEMEAWTCNTKDDYWKELVN